LRPNSTEGRGRRTGKAPPPSPTEQERRRRTGGLLPDTCPDRLPPNAFVAATSLFIGGRSLRGLRAGRGGQPAEGPGGHGFCRGHRGRASVIRCSLGEKLTHEPQQTDGVFPGVFARTVLYLFTGQVLSGNEATPYGVFSGGLAVCRQLLFLTVWLAITLRRALSLL